MRVPFIKSSIRRSKYNGWIFTTSQGEVWALGAKQTSLRYPQMWADALSHTGLKPGPKRVLMLGLGGGGALSAVHHLYPGSTVVALEYDPTMVEIARDLRKDAPYPFPEVVLADALLGLRSMQETFDLILVDLFIGIRTSPLVSTDEFWQALKKCLNPGGVALLNVAGDTTRVYDAQKHFNQSKAWQYGANTLCALW